MNEPKIEAPLIAVIDFDYGTRQSVESALREVGARTAITRDPEILRQADGLVLPGQGNFPPTMEVIRSYGLVDELERARQAGTAILGICLGMQMMFDSSTENCPVDEPAKGLGWIKGTVDRLKMSKTKMPIMGWIDVAWNENSSLDKDIPASDPFYHLHSFACQPSDESVISGWSTLEKGYVSAVRQDNLYGVQFHPEKSSRSGLQLLRNFVTICEQTDLE